MSTLISHSQGLNEWLVMHHNSGKSGVFCVMNNSAAIKMAPVAITPATLSSDEGTSCGHAGGSLMLMLGDVVRRNGFPAFDLGYPAMICFQNLDHRI